MLPSSTTRQDGGGRNRSFKAGSFANLRAVAAVMKAVHYTMPNLDEESGCERGRAGHHGSAELGPSRCIPTGPGSARYGMNFGDTSTASSVAYPLAGLAGPCHTMSFKAIQHRWHGSSLARA